MRARASPNQTLRRRDREKVAACQAASGVRHLGWAQHQAWGTHEKIIQEAMTEQVPVPFLETCQAPRSKRQLHLFSDASIGHKNTFWKHEVTEDCVASLLRARVPGCGFIFFESLENCSNLSLRDDDWQLGNWDHGARDCKRRMAGSEMDELLGTNLPLVLSYLWHAGHGCRSPVMRKWVRM